MSLRGPLGFVLFWLAAIAVGTLFVLLVLGGGFGWLLVVAAPGFALLLFASFRGRRKC